MGTIIVKRPPRAAGPSAPDGQVELAEPPVLGEPATADFGSVMGMMPMALGMGTMALMFSAANGSAGTYLMSGMMGTSMVTMSLGQIGRSGLDRKRRLRAERRDYLRYLAQLRKQALRRRRGAARRRHLGQPGARGAVVHRHRHPAVGAARQPRGLRPGPHRPGDPAGGAGVRAAADQAHRGPRAPVRDLAAAVHPGAPERRRGADRAGPAELHQRGVRRRRRGGDRADARDARPAGRLPLPGRAADRGAHRRGGPGRVGLGQVAAARPAPQGGGRRRAAAPGLDRPRHGCWTCSARRSWSGPSTTGPRCPAPPSRSWWSSRTARCFRRPPGCSGPDCATRCSSTPPAR